jgi:hypothetical protein
MVEHERLGTICSNHLIGLVGIETFYVREILLSVDKRSDTHADFYPGRIFVGGFWALGGILSCR